jgi:glycosyltransferase involved in cell wall biosynthesis
MITVETQQQQELTLEGARHRRPSVCIILPAYNEEAIIEDNVSEVLVYMESLEHLYDWHILIVNDGSGDTTRPLADKLALKHKRVYVEWHELKRRHRGF